MASTTDVVESGAQTPRFGVHSTVVSQGTRAISSQDLYKPAANSAGNSCKEPTIPSTSLLPLNKLM